MSAELLRDLFRGAETAHGTYDVTTNSPEGVKQTGKALTIKEPPTLEHWEAHLAGKRGLGIIPINEDNHCYWGCIDVDVYDSLDLQSLACMLEEKGLPLVVSRSKSGGAHLLLFAKEAVPAATMMQTLKQIAARLGYGGSEVFPKQATVLYDKGDCGNWLNMPYQNLDETVRYGLNEKGEPLMDPAEFVKFCRSREVEEEFFQQRSPIAEKNKSSKYKDAPPCVQIMLEDGVPEGGRNNVLFQVGVYLRKKYPMEWEAKIEELNYKCFDPPLSASEVLNVKKSLERKDYGYKCNDEPMCSHCDKTTCRTRKYGIDASSVFIDIHSATICLTDPPLFFVDIGGERVTLTTAELHSQTLCQQRCMEQAQTFQGTMRKDQWEKHLRILLTNMTTMSMPDDAGTKGQFLDLVNAFATGRTLSDNRMDLQRGKPVQEEDGTILFRLKDITDYLQTNNFRDWKRNRVSLELVRIGAKPIQVHTGEKQIRVWRYEPGFVPDDTERELPDLGEQEAF